MSSGLFTQQSRKYTSEYNQEVSIISQVIQRAMQQTAQSALIDQRISFNGSTIDCAGAVNIINQSTVNSQALGTFNTKASAQIANDITNRLTESIQNADTITTGFLSQPLPSNMTEAQIKRNISQVVRQTFTSENLNSMLQAVQVNQVINMQNTNIKSGDACTIGNFSAATLLAQNAMEVLTNALFTNHLTNEFMNNIKNSYNGTSRGIFSPIEDFFGVLRWGVIAIVVIVIIVVLVGGIMKLLSSRSGAQQTTMGEDIRQMLLLDALTGSKPAAGAVTVAK
jgi:hypothetical protein